MSAYRLVSLLCLVMNLVGLGVISLGWFVCMWLSV